MFFGNGIKVGKLFGIEIRLDWSWFLIVIIFGWTLEAQFAAIFPNNPAPVYWFFGIAAALLLFVSLLFHELAHSLVGKKLFGMDFRRITLFLFGGAAQFGDENNKKFSIPSAKAEFWMSLAGPLSTFALAGIFFGLFSALNGVASPFWLVTLDYLFLANLVLGIFNLLPVFPMDGGRVLRSILWAKTNNPIRATKVAYWVGLATGVGLLLFASLTNLVSPLWLGFIIFIFLIPAASAEYLSVVPDADRTRGTVEKISVLSFVIGWLFLLSAMLFLILSRG